MKEDEKTIFDTFALEGKIQSKEFRNFFFHLAKTRGRVLLFKLAIPIRYL
jgi:hypothetical protein